MIHCNFEAGRNTSLHDSARAFLAVNEYINAWVRRSGGKWRERSHQEPRLTGLTLHVPTAAKKGLSPNFAWLFPAPAIEYLEFGVSCRTREIRRRGE